MLQPSPHHVVIAGGGVAGLEALIALCSIASDRVHVTLVAPDEDFALRALSVREPFGRAAAPTYPLARVCADHGATLVRDTVCAVDPATDTVTLASGRTLTYDALLVAIGARARPAFARTTTFSGQQDAEAIHGLLQDVEGGWSSSIAFVVPTGVTWPLPLYELALMTAERAYALGQSPRLTLVTPEQEPLGIFGHQAAEAVASACRRARVELLTAVHVRDVDHGALLDPVGRIVARAERIVALPRLAAPHLPGLPTDPYGFLPADEHGRIRGVSGVFAAGDGTSFPVKQGGLAAQQADAAARVIAAEAGAHVLPKAFRPVLRGELLTGTRSVYLREALAGGEGASSSVASDERLWWPPSKVAAPYLSSYLAHLDRHARPAAKATVA